MATTKAKDIRELSVDALQARLLELKQEALNLRLQRTMGALENPSRIRQVRRDSARILTAITAKKSA